MNVYAAFKSLQSHDSLFKSEMGMYRRHVSLEIPAKLKRAVYGFTKGYNSLGICPEPLVQRNIHCLDSALDFQEVMV